MKEKIFDIEARLKTSSKCFYLSDGKILVKDNIFEGYLTNDYIIGKYDEEKFILSAELLINDLDTGEEEIFDFSIDEDDFTLPNRFCLEDKENKIFLILDVLNVSKISKGKFKENLSKIVK